MATRLAGRAVVEAIGSAFLLMAVVGSGIMAERLSGGNAGLALLANPADVPGFVLAELAGGAAATALFRWLSPPLAGRAAADVVVPHTPRKEAS